ncbi:MAG: condensation domain-containing protein [Gammaproteobacteria bacterium]
MKNVQDIYPASPMQEFMLLHGLSHSGQDTLFNQIVFCVDAPIQPSFFESAWNQVVEAHTALRTVFIWQGVDSPQQVVRQSVGVSCEVVDLSSHDDSTHEARISDLLLKDRSLGFDFRRAPLMRFTLVKLSETDWRVVWSSHHLIVDRWCIDQLIEEFQRYYAAHAALSPVTTKRAPSYRDYIAWIQQQDSETAHDHWFNYLKGFKRPTSVGRMCASAYLKDEAGSLQASHSIGSNVTRKAREFSAQIGITLGCAVQAALALAANKLVGQQDVVFGVTVAGRPAAVAHVEEIVGSFINTLPVRVRLGKDVTVADWLRDLNAAQFANAAYDYLSPAQLRTCSSIPSDQAMFDLLVVWLAQTNLQSKAVVQEGLPLEPISEQYKTAYPLTISVIETDDDLILRANVSTGKEMPLGGLLRNVFEALESLIEADPELALSQFCSLDFQIEEETEQEQYAKPGYIGPSAPDELSKSKGRAGVQVDAMQDLLCAEWRSVLAVDHEIELDADFFELGGNSLRAAALHTRLEAATRKAIPLLALYENASLRGMAETLVNEKWPLRTGISMPLQTGDTGSSLFCIASPEVNTLGYAMLTRHLSDDRNVVLLQAPPLSDDLEQLSPDELPKIAAEYVQALRDIQPAGPYSLLSMCSGAHIAFHMTRKLEAEGERVSFSGVINTWSMYSISKRFYLHRLSSIRKYYWKRLSDLASEKLGRPQHALLPAVADNVMSGVANANQAPAVQFMPADSAVGLDNPWIKQVGFADRKPADYHVDATISVFRLAKQPYWRINDSTLGWSRLSSKANVVKIECDNHFSILREPYVKQMAAALEGQLEAVETKPKSRIA